MRTEAETEQATGRVSCETEVTSIAHRDTGRDSFPAVFLVGPRYEQHAIRSGYEGFKRYIGTYLKPPVQERWSSSKWGYRLDTWISELIQRPVYSVGILLIEGAAALHMLTRRRAVYHVLYGDSDLWMLGHVARWTGNAVVASFHEGDDVLRDIAIDGRITRQISVVILLSECQRSYFERFLPAERIFVVPHGVDTDFFRPAPTLARNQMCITVGGHTRDFETLSEAIKLVWETDPTVRFEAIGTHIGHKGPPFECEGVVFRSNLSDEELLQAYQDSTIGVFSFWWAVANNSVLEAMSCGLPIVATDVGGVREYVGDEAGVLCPPGDPAALAAAMLRILSDPNRAAAMGAAARRNAMAYDFRRVAEQLRDVYQASLGASRHRSEQVQ
jgi:glycosyltransferase involved in cell wall biosynthesis